MKFIRSSGYKNNGIRKWKTLQRTAVVSISQKQALVEQVSVSERPLFKAITLFLQKAIEADEEVSRGMATDCLLG